MHVTLFIGTKRGLFVARSDERRETWRISAPHLVGREVYHTLADARTGRIWAASDHAVWGAHVHRSDDEGNSWELLDSAPHYTDERGLEAVWSLSPGAQDEPDVLLAGIEPAGLFVSRDAGATWQPVSALNEHDTNGTWQPAGGGLALHSVALDPRDPQRIYCAVSAGGSYRSEDGGNSWLPINRGVRADFLPNPQPVAGQCVHRLVLHPQRSARLYQQNHCGTYRSDDGGDSWLEITQGLPSDFGYALAVDPAEPDTAFVIPEESSHMRTTPGGMLRVFRTRDAGASWEALTEGLPQEHAYVSVLREGMCTDSLEPCGVYFGTSSGHLFASSDGGDSWRLLAGYLPRILSVTVSVR